MTSTTILDFFIRMKHEGRVRTHYCEHPKQRRPDMPLLELPEKLIADFVELRERKCTVHEIKAILHIGTATFERLRRHTGK